MSIQRAVSALSMMALFYAGTAQADIAIGVAGPMSGQSAGFGNELKTGVEAAVKAINGAGGINGELLSVISVDDACDTKRAVEVARELVARDVRAVIGHFCSGASLAAALVYGSEDVIMLSPAASNPALTENKLWNVFRLTGRDDAAADFAADAVKAAGNGLAVVISDGTVANVALANRFVSSQTQSPIITIKPGQTDLAGEAQAIAEKKYSHVFIATATTDAVRLTQALRDAGFEGQFLAAESVVSEAFAGRAGVAADGLRAVFPADPTTSSTASTVLATFKAGDTQVDGAVLPAYAAVQAFTAAAKATSVNNGRDMARWLHGNEIETVIGPLRFDSKGDLTRQPFVWYQFNAGNFRLEQN